MTDGNIPSKPRSLFSARNLLHAQKEVPFAIKATDLSRLLRKNISASPASSPRPGLGVLVTPPPLCDPPFPSGHLEAPSLPTHSAPAPAPPCAAHLWALWLSAPAWCLPPLPSQAEGSWLPRGPAWSLAVGFHPRVFNNLTLHSPGCWLQGAAASPPPFHPAVRHGHPLHIPCAAYPQPHCQHLAFLSLDVQARSCPAVPAGGDVLLSVHHQAFDFWDTSRPRVGLDTHISFLYILIL